MPTAASTLHILALGALIALAGCGDLLSHPELYSQTGAANGASDSTGTSASGGTASTTGGATTGGSTSSSATAGSTTGCPETGAAGPAITCQRADDSDRWLAVGEQVELHCTVDSGAAPIGFSGATDPALFTVDGRSGPDSIFVGLASTRLPLDFGDTQVKVTVTAHFCHAAPSATVVTLPVVGNLVAADHFGGTVQVFSSGGTALGALASAFITGPPTSLTSLTNGDLLIGTESQLIEVTRAGAKVRDFDLTDHNGASLYPANGQGSPIAPWAAAEALDGKIWVAANADSSGDGFLYRYLPSGAYYDAVPEPTNAQPAYWLPMGVARRADGAMLVTSGSTHSHPYVATYPAGSTVGAYGMVDVLTCTQGAGCVEPSFNDMGLSGLALDPGDGTVYASTIWEQEGTSDLVAFDPDTFAFKSATPHPTNSTDDLSAGGYGYRGVARAGDWLVVPVWTGCIKVFDVQTLYPIAGPGAGAGPDARGCLVPGSTTDWRAVAHLGAAP